MKKFLFILPVLLLFSITLYGQSIKFNDLMYLTTLNNGQAHNYLQESRTFKQDYVTTDNGQELVYFKSTANKSSETIITGRYTKLAQGAALRILSYTSTNIQNVINMISQAKSYGLELKFRGADNDNNIYLFDNSFYHVSIYLARNQKNGLVEIKQKEYLGLE